MDKDRRSFFKQLLVMGAASLGALRATKGLAAVRNEEPARQAYMISLFYVAGFKYYQGPSLVRKMREEDPVTMVMEPQNPYDPFAVRLEWNGEKIGYIPRTENGVVNSLLQQEAPLQGFIYQVNPKADPWEAVMVEVLMV